MEIRTVTIVGANGTMGCNVSAIFASFGNAMVFMVSRSKEKAEVARLRAAKSVRAEGIFPNLVACDYSELEDCVRKSDLVFESVAESMDVKREITRRVGKVLQEDTILCSGSSGLSLTTLSDELPRSKRGQYFGVHMFNPPYALTLCELVQTPYSSKTIATELKEYLAKVLCRTVVTCQDHPAFLGNRIGFQFINHALQLANQYKDKGGIDYIDAIFGGFTGRAMAPLLTADYVGLDVHQAIMDNLIANTNDWAHDTFTLPSFVQTLISEGKLGRKKKIGLYRTELLDDGRKKHTIFDIQSNSYRDIRCYAFPFAEKMRKALRVGDYQEAISTLLSSESEEATLCLRLLLEYIAYSLMVTKEVAFSVHSADDAMASGFGWCPPLAWIDAISSVTDFKKVFHENRPEICKDVDIDELLSQVVPSRYNYKKYLRATR